MSLECLRASMWFLVHDNYVIVYIYISVYLCVSSVGQLLYYMSDFSVITFLGSLACGITHCVECATITLLLCSLALYCV